MPGEMKINRQAKQKRLNEGKGRSKGKNARRNYALEQRNKKAKWETQRKIEIQSQKEMDAKEKRERNIARYAARQEFQDFLEISKDYLNGLPHDLKIAITKSREVEVAEQLVFWWEFEEKPLRQKIDRECRQWAREEKIRRNALLMEDRRKQEEKRQAKIAELEAKNKKPAVKYTHVPAMLVQDVVSKEAVNAINKIGNVEDATHKRIVEMKSAKNGKFARTTSMLIAKGL